MIRFEIGSLSPLAYTSLELTLQVARYFGLAAGAYALLWTGNRFRDRKLDPRPVRPGQISEEIRHSLQTILIFSANAGLLYAAHVRLGWFRLYEDPRAYGTFYLAASLPVLILLHDAYFYWTHRFMHHPRVFRLVHRVHHFSSSPTPFTIYSLHPLEATLESLFLPAIALIFPVHLAIVVGFLVATMVMNLVGHLGHELYGDGFWRSPASKILAAATHHHFHHGSPKYNYGFYFRFWDRICGTEDPRYERYRETRIASSSATVSSRPRKVS